MSSKSLIVLAIALVVIYAFYLKFIKPEFRQSLDVGARVPIPMSPTLNMATLGTVGPSNMFVPPSVATFSPPVQTAASSFTPTPVLRIRAPEREVLVDRLIRNPATTDRNLSESEAIRRFELIYGSLDTYSSEARGEIERHLSWLVDRYGDGR